METKSELKNKIDRQSANETELLNYIRELETELEEYKKLYNEVANLLNTANHKLSQISTLANRQAG